MLTVKEYFEVIFDAVRIQAQIEEVKRTELCIPRNTYLIDREETLRNDLYKVVSKMDKEVTPPEVAPIEQYVQIEMHPIEQS